MNVVKKDATIQNTGSDDEFPGSFEVILSAPTEDRDGDTLLTSEWKTPLPEHITFDQDHGMSVATTVGSGTPSINADGQLVVTGTYSSLDRAQEVRTLVRERHIRTTSVAFMTTKVTKGNGEQGVERELLNGAFVAIPSNRESVVLSSKALALAAEAVEGVEVQGLDRKAFAREVAEHLKAADGATVKTVHLKTVSGSYEQRMQAVSDALDAVHGRDDATGGYTYAWPLATSDSWVVYRVGSSDQSKRGQFRASYSIGEDGVVTLGEPERVNLVEVVQPVADATATDVPKGFRRVIAPKNFDPADAAEVDTPPEQDAGHVADDSAAAASKDAAAAEPSAADLDAQLKEIQALSVYTD